MTSLQQTLVLGIALVLAAGAIIFYKTSRYDYPLTPAQVSTIWDFELYFEFTAKGRPVRLEAEIPSNQSGAQILEEQFFSGPFGLNVVTSDSTSNRRAVWTYRLPNLRQTLRYRATVIGETGETEVTLPRNLPRPPPISNSDQNITEQARRAWFEDVRLRSADTQSFADFIISDALAENVPDEVAALLPRDPRLIDRFALAADALRVNAIPARVVNGIYLFGSERRAPVRHWLEYAIDEVGMRKFDGDPPRDFFPIWYGPANWVHYVGIDELDVQVALRPRPTAAIDVAAASVEGQHSLLAILDLYSLPITIQLVYKILLTIPVGIFILVLMRQFIGVTTLGTFMPVLIGISFRETALLNGVLLFSGIVALGLAMRFYLERLHLLLVPRLAAVLIFIIMAMTVTTALLDEPVQSLGLSIALFPMVIITMTIERMSIIWEEFSPMDAIKQGMGSLFAASITYLAMTNTYVEHWMFVFPETLLALFGLSLLVGRYTGFRLSELWRFRHLRV